MKVIVAGSRNYKNKDFIYKKLDEILKAFDDVEIVEGGANGVDFYAKQYAIDRGIPYVEFPANWDLYGRKAGPLRNGEMAHYSDALIAFYNGSKGTKNMINTAKKRNLKVYVIEV